MRNKSNTRSVTPTYKPVVWTTPSRDVPAWNWLTTARSTMRQQSHPSSQSYSPLLTLWPRDSEVAERLPTTPRRLLIRHNPNPSRDLGDLMVTSVTGKIQFWQACWALSKCQATRDYAVGQVRPYATTSSDNAIRTWFRHGWMTCGVAPFQDAK